MKYAVLATVLLLAAPPCKAELYNFYSITSNDPSGYSQFVGESQMLMDVSVLNSGSVSLTFTNAGTAQSVVSRIYFDYNNDYSLLLSTINNGSGVDFYEGRSNQSNLPAGKSLENLFDTDVVVVSRNPSPHLGINPGETLEVIVEFDGENSIFTALNNEDLRIGMHVISLGEYSESFVNVVPEPASMGMMGTGFIFSMLLRNRKRRKSNRDKNGNKLDIVDAKILGKLKRIRRRRTRHRPPLYIYNDRKHNKHPSSLRWS